MFSNFDQKNIVKLQSKEHLPNFNPKKHLQTLIKKHLQISIKRHLQTSIKKTSSNFNQKESLNFDQKESSNFDQNNIVKLQSKRTSSKFQSKKTSSNFNQKTSSNFNQKTSSNFNQKNILKFQSKEHLQTSIKRTSSKFQSKKNLLHRKIPSNFPHSEVSNCFTYLAQFCRRRQQQDGFLKSHGILEFSGGKHP